jgi:hypothetical protein
MDTNMKRVNFVSFVEDRTRYFVNPQNDVCLYKIPYRPDEEGEEFYTHKTKKHEDWAKFEGVEEEYIAESPNNILNNPDPVILERLTRFYSKRRKSIFG